MIRKYDPKDIQRIVEIYNSTTLKFNYEHLNKDQKRIILFPNLEIPHKIMSEDITLVLEIENDVVGFVSMKPDGYINFLYVDEKHFRKGYGKKLISAIENKAKELGLLKVYLYASEYAEKNEIYQNLGYIGKGKETHKIVGVDFEGIRFEKELK